MGWACMEMVSGCNEFPGGHNAMLCLTAMFTMLLCHLCFSFFCVFVNLVLQKAAAISMPAPCGNSSSSINCATPVLFTPDLLKTPLSWQPKGILSANQSTPLKQEEKERGFAKSAGSKRDLLLPMISKRASEIKYRSGSLGFFTELLMDCQGMCIFCTSSSLSDFPTRKICVNNYITLCL